jgi:hypothetical protein
MALIEHNSLGGELMLDKPREFNAVLLEFLKKHEPMRT